MRGPAHQQAAAQKPDVWHTGLAFFPAPERERNVSAARLLTHAPTPAIPRGACESGGRGVRALLA